MYRKLCIAVRITKSVSHIMYRILLYRISCIAFHVSHILYRITYMQGHGRPRGTGGHERPREATASHGRPRAAPHRPPKNIVPTKMGRPRSPERSVKKKTGDGGPRGATGGHGGPWGATARHKKAATHQPPPFNILEDPYKLRLFGE